MASLLEVVSYVGASVFGVVALFLLYMSWRFMNTIGAHLYERQSSKKDRHQQSDDRNWAKVRSFYESENAHATSRRRKSSSTKQKRTLHRQFHLHVMSYVNGVAALAVALFYLVQSTSVMLYVRPSDLLSVNPWRWLLVAPLAIALAGSMSSMFVNHYILDMAVVTVLAALAYVLLGVTILLPVGSVSFWIIFAVSIALVFISWLFLIGRHSLRASRRAATLFFLAVNALYYLLFCASTEVFGWFNQDLTYIMFLVLDALVILVPALIIMTRWFYAKFGTPLLPLPVYQAYGITHWWTHQMSAELHDMWPRSLLVVQYDKKAHKIHSKGSVDTANAAAVAAATLVPVGSQCSVCGHPEKGSTCEKKKGKKDASSSSSNENDDSNSSDLD